MNEELYCPCCGGELQEIDENSVKCLNCEMTYDIDDLDNILIEDDNSIPDCIWEAMVECDPDLKD